MPYKNKKDKNAQQKRIKQKYFKQLCKEHGGEIFVPNGGHCRLCNNAYMHAWHRRDPRRSMLINARSRAKLSGLPFNLELSDLVIPDECPVLHIKLISGLKKQADNSPSLDRIIPELGYVKKNFAIISLKANRIKNNATLEELERVTEYVRNGIK